MVGTLLVGVDTGEGELSEGAIFGLTEKLGGACGVEGGGVDAAEEEPDELDGFRAECEVLTTIK